MTEQNAKQYQTVYFRHASMATAFVALAESMGRTRNELMEIAVFAGLVALERDPASFVSLTKDYVARFNSAPESEKKEG